MFVLYVILTILFIVLIYGMITSESNDFIEAWLMMWAVIFVFLGVISIKDAYDYKFLWQYLPLTPTWCLGIVVAGAVIAFVNKITTLE